MFDASNLGGFAVEHGITPIFRSFTDRDQRVEANITVAQVFGRKFVARAAPVNRTGFAGG